MSSISHRISTIIHHKGMSIRAFEAKAGITQGVLSNAIKKDSDISSMNLSKIIDTYDEFDAHWLLTGEGTMIKTEEANSIPMIDIPSAEAQKMELPRTDEFEYINNDNGGKIPLINELAFAVMDVDDPLTTKADKYYYIEEFRNADFLMRMPGDSMEPKYKPGDLLACRNVGYDTYYQWGKIHALLTCHQGIIFGRVFEHFQNTILVRVKPENPSYPEWIIPQVEIAKVAIVVGSISLD